MLDEQVPFLEGRILKPDEHEVYEKPTVSRQTASLYEHCVRAIALNLTTGDHGLPLMGTGDWNDGMNLVGGEGKGESVWLAWFLLSLLRPFADVAAVARRNRSRRDLPPPCDRARGGDRSRRGTASGTAAPTSTMARRSDRRTIRECRIDSIAQSWAVLAGSADQARARQAMDSVSRYLVRRDDRIVLLLTPPFDVMTPSPGYIQGYVPGVRENGGQYTHAALWTVLALAQLGDGDRAAELFSMLNPLNHTRTTADGSSAIAPSRTSSRLIVTRSRHTPDAAGGPGTRARRAGCIAWASRPFSA